MGQSDIDDSLESLKRFGKPNRILEVGPGTGRYTYFLAKAKSNATIDVLDLNRHYIQQLKKLNLPIRNYFVADALKASTVVGQNRYDCIIV